MIVGIEFEELLKAYRIKIKAKQFILDVLLIVSQD